MGFEKGHKLSKGRPAGVPNKTTAAIKELVLGAVADMGGRKRLVAWIKEDPANERIFWGQIAMKVMPLEVTGPGGTPLIPPPIYMASDAPSK